MIQINLLRISPDSKYLEFSVECPTNYRFNKLFIKKYDYLTTTGYPENDRGLIDGSALYKQESTKEIMYDKISLTMAGLFIIILASLLVISQYFAEKKMKDDGFIN